MKKVLLMFALVAPGMAIHMAPASGQSYWVANPNQRVDVVNMLWNPNATNGVPGVTQTQVNVAFNNGGAKACQNANLLFEGAVTVLSGVGQVCVAPITSVTVTPIAGPVGLVFAAPGSNFPITSTYYASQFIVTDGGDPLFDATNGTVKTAGTIALTSQGQFLDELDEKGAREANKDAPK